MNNLVFNEKAEGVANPSAGGVINPSVSPPVSSPSTNPSPSNYVPPVIPVSQPAPVVKPDYAKLEGMLSKNSMISSLPEGSKLLLKFFNFNSGERQWEKFFLLQKGLVKETSNPNEEADIILSLHSKYIPQLTETNFCSIIQTANANRDLGFETALSKTALAWKFKSLYGERACFGF